MKETCIIRRIDDLGRIAIPKEIRQKLHIHEGDPMELFFDDEVVAFRKYNPTVGLMGSLERFKDDIYESNMKFQDSILEKVRGIETLLKLELEEKRDIQ